MHAFFSVSNRIWKTNASAKLGPIDTRERQSMEYRRKLREKWGNEKGVREIERYASFSPLPDLLGLLNHKPPQTSNPDLFAFHHAQYQPPPPTLYPFFLFFHLFHRLSQATTSPVKHQERRRTQKDHVGRPEDERRQSEATYEGGAYEAYGGEEE